VAAGEFRSFVFDPGNPFLREENGDVLTIVPGAVSLFLNLIDAEFGAVDEINPDLVGTVGLVVRWSCGRVTVFGASLPRLSAARLSV
jgi:hypothetical protein